MKILDCTLRDAGFYNDWIYSDKIVKQYCCIVNKLNIDKVEIGYRNPPQETIEEVYTIVRLLF